MRKAKLITTLSLTAVLLTMMTVPAMAYDIDGDLSDWDVYPPDDWVAASPAQSAYDNWGGGQTSTGSNHNPGVEQCDIEAMYVDEDVNGPYIYLGIITSMPPEGYEYSRWWRTYNLVSGDLALNFNNDNFFEYGVKLTTDSRTVSGEIGDVFWVTEWDYLDWQVGQGVVEFTNIVAGSKTGEADVVYKLYDDWKWDNGADNYVIEMKIPKAALGISGSGEVDLQATQSCANDVIIIEMFSYTPIPEFTTVAIPVGIILGLFYVYRRKRQSRWE